MLFTVVLLAACDTGTASHDSPVLWSMTSFGGAIGMPYVDDELVVTGFTASSRLVAVDRESGAIRWNALLPLPASGRSTARSWHPIWRFIAPAICSWSHRAGYTVWIGRQAESCGRSHRPTIVPGVGWPSTVTGCSPPTG
jgi:hypothetical protein